MTGKLPPLTTRRFFQATLNLLGMPYLQKLYKRSTSEIYRWAADPRTNGETRQNPLDRIKRLLEDLYERGYDDIARAAVSILANAIDCEVVPRGHPVPDGKTIEAECLDDYPRLVEFHEAIRAGKSLVEASFLASRAKREIEETLEKYRQEIG